MWRAGLGGLKDLLEQQSIRDQWAAMRSFGEYLRNHDRALQKKFVVYKASSLSAISEDQLAMMHDLPFLEIRPISGTSHFVHVTHREHIEDSILEMLQWS